MAPPNSLSVILRRRPLGDEERQVQIDTLAKELGVDAYAARVVLAGEGLGQIMRTEDRARVNDALAVLKRLGYDAAAVPTPLPHRAVIDVKRFDLSGPGIVFEDVRTSYRMPKGARALMVLAGLRGDVFQKLLRKSALTGETVTLPPREKYDSIITGAPILDLYVLPPDGRGEALGPLRIEPGRFNPASLGDRAGVSTRANLEAFVEAVRERASRTDVEMDFGLFQLPQCRFDPDENDPEALVRNREHIVRYGQYLLELYRQSGPPAATPIREGASPLTETLDKAAGRAAHANPALAQAVGLTGAALRFVEQNKAATRVSAEAVSSNDSAPALPPPPTALRRWRPWYGTAHGVFLITWMVVWLATFVSANALRGAVAFIARTWAVDRGLFFFALAGVAFYESFRFIRVKRWMDQTPTSKARSVAMGMVELKGVARRAYNLLTPLTNTPCLWFRLQKFERRQMANGNEQWARVGDSNSGPVPFYLEDETGRVLVDPLGAKLRPTHRQELDGNVRTPWGASLSLDQDTRYIEEMIADGSSVYVLGQAVATERPVVPLRERIARKLRAIKGDPARLKRYDTNGDGRIDPGEWEAARRDAEHEAYREGVEADPLAVDDVKVAIRRPDHGAFPFLVTETAEEKISSRYSLYALLLFLAAMAGTGVGVFLLLDWIGGGILV